MPTTTVKTADRAVLLWQQVVVVANRDGSVDEPGDADVLRELPHLSTRLHGKPDTTQAARPQA